MSMQEHVVAHHSEACENILQLTGQSMGEPAAAYMVI